MIVFLVGGESRLMDALITKMEKDGHKTYLLTGKRDGRGKYRRVFERYNFPYDSESVREIFTNVNPDLVIFLGAYDTNYDWSDARRESVRYTADLTNLLSAYAFKQKWSFCVPVFRSCLWPVLQQRYPRNGTGIVQKLSGNGDFAGRKYLQKLS